MQSFSNTFIAAISDSTLARVACITWLRCVNKKRMLAESVTPLSALREIWVHKKGCRQYCMRLC